mmetsp:Transcript_94755/g.178308  ORF Transcript_94755/g.178308 Transcript_94755/m.178308 type:complete len:118 (+) Transcript_94755:381-734(+)
MLVGGETAPLPSASPAGSQLFAKWSLPCPEPAGFLTRAECSGVTDIGVDSELDFCRLSKDSEGRTCASTLEPTVGIKEFDGVRGMDKLDAVENPEPGEASAVAWIPCGEDGPPDWIP